MADYAASGSAPLGWAVGLPLPRRWWTDPTHLDALLRWHEMAWTRAYTSLYRRAHRLAGGERWGNAPGAKRARAAYVEAGTARASRRLDDAA